MSRAIPELSSPRLLLRHYSLTRPEAMLDYVTRNREHLAPTEPIRNEAYFSVPHWVETLEKSVAEFKADQSYRFFLALPADPGRVIGTLNLSNVIRGAFQACYLGYGIDWEEQGKGLTSEAVQLAVRYAFGELRLHRLMANYLTDNLASARVLEKAGFVVEGVAQDYLHIGGRWRDHALTSLTNPGWVGGL